MELLQALFSLSASSSLFKSSSSNWEKSENLVLHWPFFLHKQKSSKEASEVTELTEKTARTFQWFPVS